MRKQTGLGLVVGGLIVGILAASFFMSGAPLPAAEPTRMPVPTFTPTPESVQGGYADLATEHQRSLAQAMTQVGQLLASPKLDDAFWQVQVTAAMKNVEIAYTHLLRLEPDDQWRAFHGEMTTGAADCNAAMRVLDLALTEENRQAVAIVGALLSRCQSHLTKAEQLVQEIQVP